MDAFRVTFWFVNHVDGSGGFAIEMYKDKNEMKTDIKKFLSSEKIKAVFKYSKEQELQRKSISKEFNIPLDQLYWGIVGIEKEEIKKENE